MDVPTPEQITTWSRVDFDTLGFDTDEKLQVLIDRASGWFTSITGRPVDSTMPDGFVDMTNQALQRMVEMSAYQAQPDAIETLADFMTIGSFSAGSYSETRRGLEEVQKAKMITGDPYLNQLLMGLLTPDQLDWWLSWWSGENPPWFEVTEVAWGLSGRGYGPDVPITGATYGPWSW